MRIICSDSKVVLTSHGHASSNLPFTDLDYLFTVCTQWTQYTQRVSYCILYAEPFQRATLESGKKGPHVRWNGFEWEVTLITIDSTRTRTRTSKSTRVPVGSNADHHWQLPGTRTSTRTSTSTSRSTSRSTSTQYNVLSTLVSESTAQAVGISDPSSVTLGRWNIRFAQSRHLSSLRIVASSVEGHELVPLPLHVVHLVSAERNGKKEEEWEREASYHLTMGILCISMGQPASLARSISADTTWGRADIYDPA